MIQGLVCFPWLASTRPHGLFFLPVFYPFFLRSKVHAADRYRVGLVTDPHPQPGGKDSTAHGSSIFAFVGLLFFASSSAGTIHTWWVLFASKTETMGDQAHARTYIYATYTHILPLFSRQIRSQIPNGFEPTIGSGSESLYRWREGSLYCDNIVIESRCPSRSQRSAIATPPPPLRPLLLPPSPGLSFPA